MADEVTHDDGRLSRRQMLRRMAIGGSAVAALLLQVDSAHAGHQDPPWSGHKSPAAKSPGKKSTAKKATPKKAAAKKPTTPPGQS